MFAAELLAVGMTLVPEGAPCDVRLIHSCAVTHAAERETLRLVRGARRGGAGGVPLVVVSGCLAERLSPEELRAQGADLVIGRSQRSELVRHVLERLGRKSIDTSPSLLPCFRGARALLRIQDGCNFNCAYCIIPHTRGAPTSRPWEQVLAEARGLIEVGYRELVVTGCNLALYRDPRGNLVELMAALCELDGLGRLRLGSLEPLTCEREIAARMANEPRMAPFLHLPLQCGSDRLLQAMGRRYTIEEYLESVRIIRQQVPGIGLGCDLIAGLPGETDEDVESAIEILAQMPLSKLHVFPFSPRPGTRGATLPGHPSKQAARERAARLREVGERGKRTLAHSRLGLPTEVLIETRDRAGIGTGWSGDYLPCRVEGVSPDRIGTLTKFFPAQALDGSLAGRLAEFPRT